MKVVHSELAQANSTKWCEGDKFVLTEDNDLLASLSEKHNIEHPGTGLPGTIKKLVGPLAHVSFSHGLPGIVPVEALQDSKSFTSPVAKSNSAARKSMKMEEEKFPTPQTQTALKEKTE